MPSYSNCCVTPSYFVLEYEERIPLTSMVGSVTDYRVVEEACQKVTSVFHVAGLISFGTAPDIDAMFEINVMGIFFFLHLTINSHLIYTTITKYSSCDAI